MLPPCQYGASGIGPTPNVQMFPLQQTELPLLDVVMPPGRCVASRELLKHHQKCQSTSCCICVPVKQHVQQQRLAAQRKQQQELLARQRQHMQPDRMHPQGQPLPETGMMVSSDVYAHMHMCGPVHLVRVGDLCISF